MAALAILFMISSEAFDFILFSMYGKDYTYLNNLPSALI